ncbi:MAG: peptidyl-prolyl cis-trans isomerase [Neisseria sp.]|nr:peptidyl-prolyl cis-trans isomerase [Neisseria sp.]
MNKKIFAAALAAAVSGSLMAQTLVTVNGTKIDSSEIDRQVKFLQQEGQIKGDSPALRQELLSRTVTRTLIAQEARRLKLQDMPEFKEVSEKARAAAKQHGVDKQAGFKQQWEDYQTDLLNQAFIVNTLSSNPVSEKEVKDTYDAYKKRYNGTGEVQLGQIMTSQEARAKEAVAELKAKKAFADVARRYSEEPGAAQTGGIDPNYVSLKDLEEEAPPVYNTVKNLGKGQFNKTPLVGNNIYAVFYVNDKRTISVPAFDQLKNTIGADLEERRVAAAIGALYRKAQIVPAK